ncbi:MAG: CotH kinase family protein [Firmicutes bacterium]|nr:CotH kinase family protein [Bacillota bacterium]
MKTIKSLLTAALLLCLIPASLYALRHLNYIPVLIPGTVRDEVPASVPVISVDTRGAEVLSREKYVSCSVDVFNAEAEYALSGEKGGIRVRGNSSSYYGDLRLIRDNSVPYRLKFDKKTNLLGLNGGAECKSWVLVTNNAGASDSVRNDLGLRLGRKIVGSDGYYCSDSRLVALMLNGSFKGVYTLCEQNQVNRHRVDIAEPEEGDGSVLMGYLVEIDRYNEEPRFLMDYGETSAEDVNGVARVFRSASYSVKSDIYSDDQLDFIAEYIRGAFRILYEAAENSNYLSFDSEYKTCPSSFTDSRSCLEAAFDLRSMADMYILYELLCDYDVGESSFYMCVDFTEESPRLCFTAPWDFEWIGEEDPDGGFFACAFRCEDFAEQYGDRSNPWFILLYKFDWFREMVRERWTELGGAEGIMSCVEEENAAVELFAEDMERMTETSVNSSRTVFNWISRRAAWLDEEWK